MSNEDRIFRIVFGNNVTMFLHSWMICAVLVDTEQYVRKVVIDTANQQYTLYNQEAVDFWDSYVNWMQDSQ